MSLSRAVLFREQQHNSSISQAMLWVLWDLPALCHHPTCQNTVISPAAATGSGVSGEMKSLSSLGSWHTDLWQYIQANWSAERGLFVPAEDLSCWSIQCITVQKSSAREKGTQKKLLWLGTPTPPPTALQSFPSHIARLSWSALLLGSLSLHKLTSSPFHLKNEKAVSCFSHFFLPFPPFWSSTVYPTFLCLVSQDSLYWCCPSYKVS